MELVPALRAGDEKAFLLLVENYNAVMLRVARNFVPSEAIAEEVVQEAWMGVLAGIDGFEGRCSLKGWILQILTNCAKTRGQKERRSIPWSSLTADDNSPESAVPAERFFDESHQWAGGWCAPPRAFGEDDVMSKQTLQLLSNEIAQLPEGQREVIWLRDVEGLDSDEVCLLLNLSEANQRVLLHRARSRVRAALEVQLTPGVFK